MVVRTSNRSAFAPRRHSPQLGRALSSQSNKSSSKFNQSVASSARRKPEKTKKKISMRMLNEAISIPNHDGSPMAYLQVGLLTDYRGQVKP